MRRKQPMQPIVWDGKGVIRFQANSIVQYLLDEASAKGIDLNHLARQRDRFPMVDWEQFYQLIGYSVSGYGDLTLRQSTVQEADILAEELRKKTKGRDPGQKKKLFVKCCPCGEPWGTCGYEHSRGPR